MANQPSAATVNTFIGGLKTEFTGLNFPDNACTDTQNCVFTLIGDVLRREGIDFELNGTTQTVNRTGKAITTYKWNNVGGDGETQIIVLQIGNLLYFYQSTAATISSPLSTTLLGTTIPISTYLASGSSADPSITECQFTDGNGYLFVIHPNCDPFYCTFVPGTPDTVSANIIDIQIRDFTGIYPEPGTPDITFRPTVLNHEHNYNLQNQGWTDASGWTTSSTSASNYSVNGGNITINTGIQNFVGVGSGIAAISINDPVSVTLGGSLSYVNGGVGYGQGYNLSASGVVTGYSGTTLSINITTTTTFSVPGVIGAIGNTDWGFSKNSSITNTIGTWNSALNNYPSNTDIWYSFKDTSDVFDPASTVGNVALSTTPAPSGHFIVDAFNQNRSGSSGIPGLTSITTVVRPRTGAWFAGRIWYAGADNSQLATGDAPFYTWTENIYFSQIITNINQAGSCYQTNDPTDENLSDLLPSDGGVITIQGSGAIYKLFPIQNGMLVFAANGIWFITGSTGIGFVANDYTITKISGIQNIAGTSHVNVMGFPIFWNEEGIYAVTPGQQGALTVTNMCLGTILTFYGNIPLISKKFARGDYNPISFDLQWCYRSTNESSLTDRYQFDTVLVFNVETKAFYYYTLPAGVPYLHDIRYVAGPGGSTSPDPVFKYLTSYANSGSYKFTFSEERDATNYVDWFSYDGVGANYISYFITGYKLSPRAHPFYGMYGQFYKKFNVNYLYMFLRNTVNNSYKIQGLYDFGSSGNSGKWSTVQIINDNTSTANFAMIFKRHRIRGHGIALQFKVQSVDGKAFDIMGWSGQESFNTGM